MGSTYVAPHFYRTTFGGVMTSHKNLDLNAVLDGLGPGVLIFNSEGRLILDNLAARTLLGKELELIRKAGWEAASTLFNTLQTDPDKMLEGVRDQALQSDAPVRFYTYLGGEYIPCWAAAVNNTAGGIDLMITMEMPDWSSITTLLDRFKGELRDAIDSTQGHIDIITQTITHYDPKGNVSGLSKRLTGFTRLIAIHMNRVARFMDMMERLEAIRIGRVHETVRTHRRRIRVESFLEDFEEELDEIQLVDPETDAADHRSRLQLTYSPDLTIGASQTHLTQILHDILRNAIMYSMKATPISVTVRAKDKRVQFDITDQGYGIREKERSRVFDPFKRAMQPQIMAEFGYGLSMYLCKQEVEAMNGTMWFESQEGVGTTFSFTLPTWQGDSASSSDTDQTG
jgi:hypothetical protein